MSFIGDGSTLTGLDAGDISAGTLAVARGGTGASTLTANNVLLGNGTSAVQAVAPGTSGNVLTSNGTTWTSAAISAGNMSVDTNTSGAATNYALGQYVFMASNSPNNVILLNSSRTVQYFTTAARSTIFQDATQQYTPTAANISGTWRSRGCIGFDSVNGNRFDICNSSSTPWYSNASGAIYLMQRTA